jgi:hypothetical protein
MIMALLPASICCICAGLVNGNSLLALSGASLLIGLWLWARYSRGANSLNYIGTTFVGDNCHGGLITKWISFALPVLPVRSFILVMPAADAEAFDLIASRTNAHDIQANFSIIPLPGLGIDWEGVSTTYVTAFVMFVVILVLSIVKTYVEM